VTRPQACETEARKTCLFRIGELRLRFGRAVAIVLIDLPGRWLPYREKIEADAAINAQLLDFSSHHPSPDVLHQLLRLPY
jgi:uncharacterized protein (DUF3820 family)